MSDFIHCNICLHYGLTDQRIKYYLTQCEKVMCSECLNTAIHKCAKCGPNTCRWIELNSTTKPDIQLCFQDITSQFRRLEKVENFQKQQRNRLIKGLIARNQQLDANCSQNQLKIENLENENKILRQQIKLSNNIVKPTPMAANLFESMFESKLKTETNESKTFGEELFTNEAQKQPIYDNTIPQIDDQFKPPLNSIDGNQFKINETILSNPSIRSMNKKYSPLQSIRNHRISLGNTLKVIPRHTMLSTDPNSRITDRFINSLKPPELSPMTVTKSKGFVTNLSTLSSVSTRTPIKSSPSTSYSSILKIVTIFETFQCN
ncbi:uncharacterized protein LOC128960305 [Oppia nitens]|uniref:uncharacterized protein LOC128960305 n=1 Tax=Oppia nitens TaxID=1686743 RepID=UPI0023DB37EC|nr:uncharacterized protein LOC128960305 [Oppia nitens]